jgi:hypothetical protein
MGPACGLVGGVGAATGALDVAVGTARTDEDREPTVGADGPQAASVPTATRLPITVRYLMIVFHLTIGYRCHERPARHG